MYFQTNAIASTIIFGGLTASLGFAQSTTSAPPPKANTGEGAANFDESLVPQFGINAGVNPSGGIVNGVPTGSCDGLNGNKIPCFCPPDRTQFIAKLRKNVAAGTLFGALDMSFPTTNSTADQIARLNTCVNTLQNFRDDTKRGFGCPGVSTTFVRDRDNLQKQNAAAVKK